MKILMIGAGGQGAPCASILSRDPDVEKVIVGDINLDMAMSVIKMIGSEKLTAVKIDASNTGEITTHAKETDVIIDLVSTEFTAGIMQAALDSGVNYINSAFSRDLWDFDLKQGKKPKLYEEFKTAGLTALLGCGMSAGYTNVIVRHHADMLDTLKSVKIRLAKKDTSISEEEEIIKPWDPGWNPRVAFMDFVNSVTAFMDGNYKTFEKPFSEIEEWDFPEPVGKMLVSLHAHEEMYSMPITFENRGIEYVDFKYYVNKQVAPLVALGFGNIPEVTVKGGTVSPLDVLMKLVPAPNLSSLENNAEGFERADATKHVSIMIEIKGTRTGKNVKYLITIPDMNKPRQQIYEIFGTTAVNVALPVVIGMKMAMEGTKKGVIFAEELDPNRFIELIRMTGYPNKWETKEIIEQ